MAGIPTITRSLRSMPSIVSKATSQAPYQPLMHAPQYQAYYQPQQLVLLPYGTPLMYTGMTYYQPVTYPQFQQQPIQFVAQSYNPQYSATDFSRSRSTYYPQEAEQTNERAEPVLNGFSNIGYLSELPDISHGRGNLTIHMEVPELNQNIRLQLDSNQHCRVSWLNRMLSKCNNADEFGQAFELYKLFQQKNLETTSETATLLIKAACRAEIPETALELLKMDDSLISPTLGGIHYLMINFSLKKDTRSVIETYEIAKRLDLQPTTRTFHILIRECIDNDLIDEAMEFALECKNMNIVPNRVTYNILMNGLRKYFKGSDILELRQQMNEHKIEINDTTIKFTVLAHMMLHQEAEAIDEFFRYDQIDTDLEKFSLKFFEVSDESINQKKLVTSLFKHLKERKRIELPATIESRLSALAGEIKAAK